MRVLVTGNLGYLGEPVVGELEAEGYSVVGLDSGLFADCGLEAGRPMETIQCDVRDVALADLRGYQAVVHLAGLSNDPLGSLDPALTHEVNVEATLRLARLCREAGASRFLLSSSCSVYGAATEEWVDEGSVPRPVTPYGASKLAAERGLIELAGPTFVTACLRNATAFGYSPRLRTDLVVNDLAAGAWLRRELRLTSDGSAWRPIVHVDDIARAFACALAAPAAVINGQVVNVGSTEQNYRIVDLARSVASLVPDARVVVPAGGSADRRSYRVRFARVARVLPTFRCATGLEPGVRALMAAFRRTGLRSTGGLVRLDRLQHLRRAGLVDESLRLVAPAAAAS
jgi:nucleoside-diphosphate-sugar epimerase